MGNGVRCSMRMVTGREPGAMTRIAGRIGAGLSTGRADAQTRGAGAQQQAPRQQQ